MSYSIKHLCHINSPKADVFKAISTIEGLTNWWTVDTTGESILNGIIKFQFGNQGGPTMQVIESHVNQKIVWKCVDKDHPWFGHEFIFKLDENEEKCRIRFAHTGWKEQDDFFAGCNFSWGRYMESLRQFCQTGIGEAFGSKGYN